MEQAKQDTSTWSRVRLTNSRFQVSDKSVFEGRDGAGVVHGGLRPESLRPVGGGDGASWGGWVWWWCCARWGGEATILTAGTRTSRRQQRKLPTPYRGAGRSAPVQASCVCVRACACACACASVCVCLAARARQSRVAVVVVGLEECIARLRPCTAPAHAHCIVGAELVHRPTPAASSGCTQGRKNVAKSYRISEFEFLGHSPD